MTGIMLLAIPPGLLAIGIIYFLVALRKLKSPMPFRKSRKNF